MNLKNISINVIINVIIKMGAVLISILTARWATVYLSVSDLAEYNTIIAYTTILLTILNFGLPDLIQKVYTNSEEKNQRYQTWTAMLILRFISFLFGIFIILFTYRFSGSEDIALVASFFTVQFILIIDLHYRSVCDAGGRSWQFSLADLFAKVLAVLALYSGIFWLGLESSVWFLLTCLAAGYTLSLVIDIVWQYHDTKLAKPSFEIVRIQFWPIILLSVSNIMFAAYSTTDKLIISWLGLPDAALNGYVNAYKIFESALIIPGVAIPMLASFMKKRYDTKIISSLSSAFLESKKIIPYRFVFLLEWWIISGSIGLFLFSGIMIMGPILISFIDPNNLYPKAYEALPWLALAALINPIVVMMARFTLFFKNGEKLELTGTFIIMIIALTSYLILIPRYGIVGAAISTALTIFIDLIIKLFFINLVTKDSKITA